MAIDSKQVQSIFLAAVAAPNADARLKILSERAGNDPELRQRIEALLRAHDAPRVFSRIRRSLPFI